MGRGRSTYVTLIPPSSHSKGYINRICLCRANRVATLGKPQLILAIARTFYLFAKTYL